jgi:hypothetical protein
MTASDVRAAYLYLFAHAQGRGGGVPGDSALAGQAARALRSSDGRRGHPGMFTHMDEGTIKTQNPKCRLYWCLKGLSHEIDFKTVDENGQILTLIRAAAGF